MTPLLWCTYIALQCQFPSANKSTHKFLQFLFSGCAFAATVWPLLIVIYACTYDLFGPVRNVFDACRFITRASGRELWNGPVKWHRADMRLPFGAQKSSVAVPDSNPDPLGRGMDPDPSIKQKCKKNLDSYYFVTLYDVLSLKNLLKVMSRTCC